MTQVAIIGAGPVGTTLANLLGRRGVETVVLEKQPGPYDLPRAIHFDGEAMRCFQAAGLSEKIEPFTMVGKGMLFKTMEGELLVDWSRDQTPGPMGWYESYRFYQPGVERVLRDGLDRFDHVTLRTEVEVTGLAQDADGATVTLDTGEELRADYVVGCDGTNSFTREFIGSPLEDLGFAERWMVVDLMLKRPRDDLGDYSIQFCHPETPGTYVRGVGDRRRWEMRLEDGDPDVLPEELVWKKLSRWITPEDAELERSAVYTFRSRIAEFWQQGRILLAGDSAHQMPPFMGQGMCAGVRDAANLNWKLAAALNGNPEALETYSDERRENVREFIALSVALGRLINQTGAGDVPKGQMKSIWPGLGPGLGPRDDVAGRLVPQPRTSENVRADTAFGHGFYVVSSLAVDSPLPVVVGAEDWLAERGLAAVIVRPDGYALAGVPTGSSVAAVLASDAALASAVPLAGV